MRARHEIARSYLTFSSRAVPNSSTDFLHFHTVTMEILTVAPTSDKEHSPWRRSILGGFLSVNDDARYLGTLFSRSANVNEVNVTRYVARYNKSSQRKLLHPRNIAFCYPNELLVEKGSCRLRKFTRWTVSYAYSV